jgi:hypothetical protein|tara:strand:+ start:275 stop:646 length:372 start_codon:yes stop_codon:yes gene_type:complete
MSIYSDWIDAKAAEKNAVEQRRSIEDQLFNNFSKHNFEGTIIINDDGYNMKIVERLTNKVDGDRLQELATEAGLTEHLGSLFRWTPTINMAVWKAADSSITEALLGAVTTKANRPSFNIEKDA